MQHRLGLARVPHENGLIQVKGALAWYKSSNEDCNRIDDRELRILSKGKLPSLLELHLSTTSLMFR